MRSYAISPALRYCPRARCTAPRAGQKRYPLGESKEDPANTADGPEQGDTDQRLRWNGDYRYDEAGLGALMRN